MPYCCAINCHERARKGGISFHSFPLDPTLRRRWLEIIHREDYTPTKHSKLCSKHFREEDFERHFGLTKLKKGVLPTIVYQKGNALPPKRISPKKRTSLPTTHKSLTIGLNTVNFNFGNSVDAQNNNGIEDTVDTESKASQSLTLNCNIVNNSTAYSDESKEVLSSHELICRNDIHSEDSERIIKRPISIGRKNYVMDYKLSDMSSPVEATEFYELATKVVKEKSKMVKVFRERTKRLEKGIRRLKTFLRFYQDYCNLSENALQRLKILKKQVDLGSKPSLVLEHGEISSDRAVEMDTTSPNPSGVNAPDVSTPGPSRCSETTSIMMEQEAHLAMTCDNYPESPKHKDSLSAETSDVSNSDGSLFEPPFLIKEEPVSFENE